MKDEKITMNESNELLDEFNYKQELKRNLKFFSSFAVAFSFISITTGIFSSYQFVLTTAGPAGIWSWIITAVGQLLVALIFAELASAMPISGYSYQWVKRLSTPRLGWVTGWICVCFLILVVPSIDGGLAPVVASLIGIKATTFNIAMIVIITLVIQATLNIVGVKLASLINNAAVFTESVGIILLTAILLVVAFKNGNNPSILFNTAKTGSGLSYIKPFMMSMLLGAFTIVGFETAANLSEETVNANKTVPRAIIGSVAIAGIFGAMFLIAVTFSIKNLSKVIASNNPLPYIIQTNLGSVVGNIFLVVVIISIFACGTVSMTSGSRLIYAMARDNAFFFSSTFKKVSPKTSSPVAATILILVFAIAATIFSGSITLLVGVCSILPAVIYLITTVCYGLERHKIKFEEGNFNLGKAAKPVIIAATIWLIVELGILTLPAEFHATAIVAIVLIAIGFVLYSLVFKKRVESSEDYSSNEKEEAV